MFEILTITSPIYAIILLGFLLTRAGLFSKQEMRVFGKFVINLALPALLFRSIYERRISEILNVDYLLAYLTGTFALIGLGFFWFRQTARLHPATSTFYVIGMTCSNSGYMGYPILLLTLGSVAGVSLGLNLMLENLVVIPFLLLMAEYSRGGTGVLRTLKLSFFRVLSNPMIIGLLAGVCVAVLEWELPAPIVQTVNLISASAIAVALFIIGGTLVGLPIRGLGKQVLPIVAGKLFLHPLLVLSSILVLSRSGIVAIDPELSMAAVLMAAMPMMGIYPTLAQAYGQEDSSAAALLLATVVSFFSLSGLIWIFRNFSVFV